MNQPRDSHGKFKKCLLKQIKIEVKDWWENYRDMIYALSCVAVTIFIAITTCVWLFGDKITEKEVCVKYQGWGCHNDDCSSIGCYAKEFHSHYTIPEAIGVEWNFVKERVGGFITWIGSHPVI